MIADKFKAVIVKLSKEDVDIVFEAFNSMPDHAFMMVLEDAIEQKMLAEEQPVPCAANNKLCEDADAIAWQPEDW